MLCVADADNHFILKLSEIENNISACVVLTEEQGDNACEAIYFARCRHFEPKQAEQWQEIENEIDRQLSLLEKNA